MSDQTEPVIERIDIDLTGIDQPNAFVDPGNYTLTLADIKVKRSKTDRPMLECFWKLINPTNNEEVTVRDYPMLDDQRGKFRLRQIVYAAKADERNYTVPQLVGASALAELDIDETDEYGKQNRIKRLLVEVPKAVRL